MQRFENNKKVKLDLTNTDCGDYSNPPLTQHTKLGYVCCCSSHI